MPRPQQVINERIFEATRACFHEHGPAALVSCIAKSLILLRKKLAAWLRRAAPHASSRAAGGLAPDGETESGSPP